MAPANRIAHGNLERRGMNRVLSYGPDGFERMVMPAVLALNIHLVGLRKRKLLLEVLKRATRRRRRDKKAARPGAFRKLRKCSHPPRRGDRSCANDS